MSGYHNALGYGQTKYFGIGTEGRPAVLMNAALASNGSIATATSTYVGYDPMAVINGIRHTQGNWAAPGSGWSGANGAGFPQTVEINFGQSRDLYELDVYGLADIVSYNTAPLATDTFTTTGLSSYDLDYWNGTAWINIVHVTGNNLVWRKFMFSKKVASKVRCICLASPSGAASMVEFEAWTDV